MVIPKFPPVETATPEGILAIGGDLNLASLKLAYSSGIFPWPTEDFPLLWFAPPRRAILEFKNFKIPKRLQRDLKKKGYLFKVDENFPAVIRACAEGKTRKSVGTWITEEMIEAYNLSHRSGFAHSFECYHASGKLVGGLYGVSLGRMFCGESMFFLESGASKATLIYVVDFLKSRGATWMDVQVMSPLLKSFGAVEIPRKLFMEKLKKALGEKSIF